MKDILNDAVKSHYDKEDYTEVVRDALLCLTTEIRKKSNVTLDGVDLINKAFSSKKPLIKINNLETETDKSKQAGIMDLSKGLIEYFRNPMSHSKQSYSKKLTDALLVLLDEVILEEIIDSKGINNIQDWYLEISNDLSPNSERYAKNLIKTIPQNKCFDLSVMLYKNRNETIKKKDKVINELVNGLAPKEFSKYCQIIEKDLFGDINEDKIISSLKFISPRIWNKFSPLMKSKLEEVILEDISNYYIDSQWTQQNGYLAESSLHIIQDFSNLKIILNVVIEQIIKNNCDSNLLKNYFDLIVKNMEVNNDLISLMQDGLRNTYGHPVLWYKNVFNTIKATPKNNDWYIHLAKMFPLKEQNIISEFDLLEGIPFE